MSSKKKNIQVIDGAENACFDIFTINEEDFRCLFPDQGQEIEFSEDFFEREGENAQVIWNRLWDNLREKRTVDGIHGTLFCGLLERKVHFPEKKWDVDWRDVQEHLGIISSLTR